MGKFEDAMRAEVLRLVHKEIRQEITPLHKELRELKRMLRGARQQVSKVEASAGAATAATPLEASHEEVGRSRMSGGLIRRLRHRLGITQMQLSHLLGVARGTVALWETDKIRPTGKNRAALVGLRRVGRRDVAKMLDARRAAKSG